MVARQQGGEAGGGARVACSGGTRLDGGDLVRADDQVVRVLNVDAVVLARAYTTNQLILSPLLSHLM